MRIGIYVVLAVLISLLIADRYYIKQQRATPAVVQNYDLHDIDSVIATVHDLQRDHKDEDALLLIYDAQKMHPQQIKLLLARAVSLIALKQQASAVDALDKVLDENPHQEEALLLRAECLGDLQRSDEALKNIAQLLELNAENDEALSLQGTLFFHQGAYPAAIKSFTDSLAAEPRAVTSLYNRALCYAAVNDYVKARADLSMFIEMSDSDEYKKQATGILKEWQDK